MPKGSEELTNARKEEIINSCASLYEHMSFKEITIKEIGKATSFTRTSIYNYFRTKEEIFLALLQREYEAWIEELEVLLYQNVQMTEDDFASALAHTLEKRERLLKILSMNHYDMEENSRIESLTAFKVTYGKSMKVLRQCLEKFFPNMTASDIQDFIYAFFPFILGVYPYTFVTGKQREAMEQADANYVFLSVYEITYACVRRLLKSCE